MTLLIFLLGMQVNLGSQPRGMDIKGDTTVVSCVNEISVVQGGRKVSSLPISFEPSSVSISPDSDDVAVGGSDNKVRSIGPVAVLGCNFLFFRYIFIPWWDQV